MRISRGFAMTTLMTLAASPVFAFNLNDAANAVSNLQGGNNSGSAVAGAPDAASLFTTLGSQLKVTPQQAIGGAGAMLGLAKNKLSSSDYSQLTRQVPGLDSLSTLGALGGLGSMLGNSSGGQGALGDVKTTGDMDSAFSALGMSSGMIGQFAPVILQYLSQQGVGGTLLNSLGSIWGAGS